MSARTENITVRAGRELTLASASGVRVGVPTGAVRARLVARRIDTAGWNGALVVRSWGGAALMDAPTIAEPVHPELESAVELTEDQLAGVSALAVSRGGSSAAVVAVHAVFEVAV